MLLALGAAGCPSKERKVVTIFHAASLSRSLSGLEEKVEARHTDLDLRLEPSGSQVAARKLSELNRTADLVFVADWRVIEELLVPDHAEWQIQFAANELVLAHAEPPYLRHGKPKELRYALVFRRRAGSAHQTEPGDVNEEGVGTADPTGLRSTFVSVIEPYLDRRNVVSCRRLRLPRGGIGAQRGIHRLGRHRAGRGSAERRDRPGGRG